MDDASAGSIFSKIVIAIFIVVLFDLAFVNWWILNRANSAQVYTAPSERIVEKTVPANRDLSLADKTIASDSVEQTAVTNQPSDKSSNSNSAVVADQNIVVQTSNKEIFVPLGSGQNKGSTYTDLLGTEVSIDSAKYSEIESVNFESAIWVEGGNGKAWAQINNVTDNNPLIESQISSSSPIPILKTSTKIPISSGLKTYRVQVKSEFSDYIAYIENARLKIVLK